jgi:hypothetical protein
MDAVPFLFEDPEFRDEPESGKPDIPGSKTLFLAFLIYNGWIVFILASIQIIHKLEDVFLIGDLNYKLPPNYKRNTSFLD